MHMTAEETAALLERWHATGDPEAREALLMGHLYIAALVARRFSGRGVEYDDLYQTATLALLRALDRFDPARGLRFVTFATPCVTGEVQNWLRDHATVIRMPRRTRETALRVRRAREALEKRLGRSVRVSELSEETGIDEETILEALEFPVAPLSLDTAPDEEGATAAMDRFLAAEEEGYRRFEDGETLRALLPTLTEDEQTVLRLRYFDGLSQKAAAEQLGVSQMTVSRREKQALTHLRERLDNT